MQSKTVLRHSLLVRVNHWMIALSGLVLAFSGLMQMPMAKRYNIVKVPGLAWTEEYSVTLILHYGSAVIFSIFVFYHIVYHLKRKELAIMPKPGDLAEGFQGFKAMIGLAEEPKHEKFQAKQRIIYAVIGSVSMLLIVTGLVKSYKNMGDIILSPMFLQMVTMLHTVLGMLFLALFFAHVGALALKGHRPLIPSMFSGRIDREYAEKHLPGWKID